MNFARIFIALVEAKKDLKQGEKPRPREIR